MLVDEKYRIGVLAEKANESLGAAEFLMEQHQFEEAVNRCYHAAFFILRAYLKKNGSVCEKTSESLALFKKEFVDAAVVSSALFDDLVFVIDTSGFDKADAVEIGEPLAREVYERADRFYSELSNLI